MEAFEAFEALEANLGPGDAGVVPVRESRPIETVFVFLRLFIVLPVIVWSIPLTIAAWTHELRIEKFQ